MNGIPLEDLKTRAETLVKNLGRNLTEKEVKNVTLLLIHSTGVQRVDFTGGIMADNAGTVPMTS